MRQPQIDTDTAIMNVSNAELKFMKSEKQYSQRNLYFPKNKRRITKIFSSTAAQDGIWKFGVGSKFQFFQRH